MAIPLVRRLACVLLILLAAALPARGQGFIDDAGPFGMPVPRRTVLKAAELLAFDADQKAAGLALYEGYRAAFLASTKEMDKKLDEHRKVLYEEVGVDAVKHQQTHAALVMGYVEGIQGLEGRLLADLKELCTPAQAERFASVERLRRRQMGFVLPLASGDGIELPDVLRTIEAERTPAVEEVLARWETDVDRQVQEKERIFRTYMPKLVSNDGSPERMKEVQGMLTELFAVSVTTRDTTRRAVRELEPLIAEEKRGALKREFTRLEFPQVYRSHVRELMAAALRLGDVTEEQKAGLAELIAAYEKEVAPVNVRFAAACEEKQEQMGKDFMGMMEAMSLAGEDSKDPFTEARTERQLLDKKYREKLVEMLKKEQYERLPEEPRDSGTPEFLPDFEGNFEKEWEDFSGGEEE